MDERTYQKLERQIKDDFKKRMDALNLLWAMSNDSPAPSTATATASPSRRRKTSEPNRTALVESIIKNIHSDFTHNDIERFFCEEHPDVECSTNFFSNALSRLLKRKFIVQVKASKGRRSAVYRYNDPELAKMFDSAPNDKSVSAWEE